MKDSQKSFAKRRIILKKVFSLYPSLNTQFRKTFSTLIYMIANRLKPLEFSKIEKLRNKSKFLYEELKD